MFDHYLALFIIGQLVMDEELLVDFVQFSLTIITLACEGGDVDAFCEAVLA